MSGLYRLVKDPNVRVLRYRVERWSHPGWLLDEMFATKFFAKLYIQRRLRELPENRKPREILQVYG